MHEEDRRAATDLLEIELHPVSGRHQRHRRSPSPGIVRVTDLATIIVDATEASTLRHASLGLRHAACRLLLDRGGQLGPARRELAEIVEMERQEDGEFDR